MFSTGGTRGGEVLLALGERGAGVPLRELALVGLAAAVITYFATGPVRVLACRIGAVAVPRERDVHVTPVPRMGGLAMYLGVVAGVFLASQLPALTRGFVYSTGMPAVLVAGGVILAVGLIDDRWGLDALTKFAGQITAASVLVTMGVAWSVLYIPIGGVGTLVLDQTASILLTLALTVSIVNAMNFVDGLDGLAAGSSAIIGVALGVLAYMSSHFEFASFLNIMFIPGAEELVVFAAAFIGATVGFLWYNSYPAQVFMGDTGSLTLGGIIAVFAIIIRKELLIPILCGIFFAESISVMMQVAYFKYTKKKYGVGKRIFKMTPLHHHFQKPGNAGIEALLQKPFNVVPESKIVVRFWLIGIILAVITIVTLKMR